MKKIKENKLLFIISLLICLLPLFVGLILWDKLPAQIATHFNTKGVADSYSSKAFTVFFFPAFFVGMQVFLAIATGLDPKNDKEAVNDKIYALCLCILPFVAIFVTTLVYGKALNYNINVNLCGCLFIGIVFLVIGNYMPKTRPNYTIGVKVPWTLDDPDNWYHTHRFAGITFVVGGLLMIILGFIGNGNLLIYGLIVAIILALAPILYSFLYFLKRNKQ